MIAAIAAAVSATSTLRLVSDPSGFSSTTAFEEGADPLEELCADVGPETCAAGALTATGSTKPAGEVIDLTATLPTGALWYPSA